MNMNDLNVLLDKHGFKNDTQVDFVFDKGNANLALLGPASDDLPDWQFRVNYALHQWYIFYGMDVHLMTRCIIEKYGWTIEGWTRVQQMYLMCVWLPLYSKMHGALPTDTGFDQLVIDLWSADDANTVLVKEY